jgi:NADP-dependent 3-hydroxy acid dehydrogenase YdfG
MSAEAEKRALVTGASSGIGETTVRHLRRAGYAVTAVARRRDRLAALAAETGAETLELDVTDTAGVYQQLSGRRFDVLVNNAGVGRGFAGFLRTSPADIERTVRTNVEATIHVVRAVVPGMIEAGRGHIVHLGSVAGIYPISSAVYGATKGATHLFAQTLRVELLGTGVRSTEIIPGRVATEFFAVAIDDEELRRKVQADITILTADDVAAAIVWALAAPPHVDVATIEISPTDQVFGGTQFRRSRAGSP